MLRALLLSIVCLASDCLTQKPAEAKTPAETARTLARPLSKEHDKFVRLVDDASKLRKAESLQFAQRLEALPKYSAPLALSEKEWEDFLEVQSKQTSEGLKLRLQVLKDRTDAATWAINDQKVTVAEATAAVDSYLGSMLDLAVFVRAAIAGAPSYQLTITTVDSKAQDLKDREKSGYEVWYVPEIYKSEKLKALRFEKLSSPTVSKLPPGYYMVWCRQAGSTTTAAPQDSMKVIVNENKPIDLAIPKS